MTTQTGFDPQAFRAALGTFTTGVTIITTRAADGEAIGITANSFNSVSLNPPLVLWSLAKNARSLAAFSTAKHWNVHVLSAEQEALSGRFARQGEDKFGSTTALDYEHAFKPTLSLHWQNATTISEKTDDFAWGSSLACSSASATIASCRARWW